MKFKLHGEPIIEVPTLECLKERAELRLSEFTDLLSTRYGVDRYVWFRALPQPEWATRRNDDTSQDAALAADADLKRLWDAHIEALHAFYLARDGAGGVLGGRGVEVIQ